MLLLGEIGIEIAMIVAVVVAVGCLAHLLQLSIREQIYLRRIRRQRIAAVSGVVHAPQPPRDLPRPVAMRRANRGVLRHKHV